MRHQSVLKSFNSEMGFALVRLAFITRCIWKDPAHRQKEPGFLEPVTGVVRIQRRVSQMGGPFVHRESPSKSLLAVHVLSFLSSFIFFSFLLFFLVSLSLPSALCIHEGC